MIVISSMTEVKTALITRGQYYETKEEASERSTLYLHIYTANDKVEKLAPIDAAPSNETRFPP